MDFARAAVLANYEEVARSCGLDPQRMIARAGINPVFLKDPEALIPLSAAARLLEDSAAASGCNEFGLLLAERRPYSALGALSLLLIHLPTLREVVEAFVRYQQVLAGWPFLSIEDMGETEFVHVQIVSETPIAIRQLLDWLMLAVSRTFTIVSGDEWRPESAHFELDAPGDIRVHLRTFPCPVVFESSFTGFVCPLEMLRRSNPRADAAMATHARYYLESLRTPLDTGSLAACVRRALHLLLPTGRGTLDQVAELLHHQPRTIQRQLKHDRLSFAQILNGVRRELAIRYLQGSDLTLVAISHLLGYATPSSFARWFQEEFACSPTEWRRNHRAPPSANISSQRSKGKG